MFRIDTSAVSTAASDINRVKTKIGNVENSVGGYDVVAIEIDLKGISSSGITALFNKAKQNIVNGISTANSRVDVTSKQLEQISKAHEELQNMLGSGELKGISSNGDKIHKPAAVTLSAFTSDPGADETTSGDSDDTTSGDSPPNAVHSGDDSDQTADSPDTEEVQGPKYQGDSKIKRGTTPSQFVVTDKKNSGAKKRNTKTTQSKNDKTKKKNDNNTPNVESNDDESVSLPIPSTVGSIIVPTVSDSSLGEVLSNSSITYDETGYAKLDDRFILSCSEKYGKIGDIIQIKDKNGEIHECIIGNVTKTDGFNMYVNNKYTFSSDNIDSRLNGNFDSIRNLTNSQNTSTVTKITTPSTNSETSVESSSNGSNVTNNIDTNKQQSSSSNVEAVNELYKIDS